MIFGYFFLAWFNLRFTPFPKAKVANTPNPIIVEGSGTLRVVVIERSSPVVSSLWILGEPNTKSKICPSSRDKSVLKEPLSNVPDKKSA